MAVVGFDFGTTNSLISLITRDGVISFADDEGRPTPSVVSYEGSKTTVGREAREKLSEPGLGVHGAIVRSPKTLIGRESVFVAGVQRSPVDIVEDVIAFIRKQAQESEKVQGLEIDRAVVTIPVNMNGERRALLRDAFRAAGIGVVQFLHEPLAALYAYLRDRSDFEPTVRRLDRQMVLVFDWGGGTLDLTFCQLTDGMLVQIANDGTDKVGGDHFDAALRREIEKRFRQSKLISENVTVQPEAKGRLLHRCEQAKIDLSGRAKSEIFVTNFFDGLEDPDLSMTLDRKMMESIVLPLLDMGLDRIQSLLRREGYSPASISMCLATGGMVNMPVVRSRLNEIFGPQCVHVPERSASIISEGAAWVAFDEAKLLLAKQLELTLARNSHMTLLAAGFEMPLEGEVRRERFTLYCSDPTDGFGRFELVTPNKPGPRILRGDARRPLAHFQLRVDRCSKPLSERLELDINVDDNLILHAAARSTNAIEVSRTEVHELEFAIGLPARDSSDEKLNLPTLKTTRTTDQPGALIMRANLASADNDWASVPGEVLHDYNSDPSNIYMRSEPTDTQRGEYLYYQPCSGCGRRSNDPKCRCSTTYSLR